MEISKKDRDKAMQILCDFQRTRKPGTHIKPDYLHHHGLSKNIDAQQMVDVLCAMGYATYKKPPYLNEPYVELTDEGRCYFERKADLSAEKRSALIRYIITTAIASLALILSVVSLIWQISTWRSEKAVPTDTTESPEPTTVLDDQASN